MLIRFVIKNLFSFFEAKEFNMLPSRPQSKKLSHHKYNINDFELLKMSSVYGANGAGKSNLIKSLFLLKEMILNEDIPKSFTDKQFKLLKPKNKLSQILSVEFFQNEKSFYYALLINDGIVFTEELYESGLGKKDDKLIFERKTDKDKKTRLKFSDQFESSHENLVLKKVIEKSLSKPNKPILKLLTTLENPYLADIGTALNWFEETLQIVMPEAKPIALAHQIDIDKAFRQYASDIMLSFNTGIQGIKPESKKLNDYFGEDIELDELLKDIEDSPQKMIALKNSRNGDDIILVKEDEQVLVKQLKLEHTGKDGVIAYFNLDEESDGTVRLLDFIPVFDSVVSKNKVFVIDEIERSIHPLLIKALVEKFSQDKQSNGQLIFTTHESSLLDQSIFRPDEIWFVEKDQTGCTDIYPLSDFKEHNITGIRKGYLNGRYGSIPFLANLKDLNWHQYDTEE
jgi:uncharacterized protein